jgi:membrane protein YdbS with pleckstrin-like domain
MPEPDNPNGPARHEPRPSVPGAAAALADASRRATGEPPGGAQPPDGAETDIWAGRTSWKHYAGRILLWFFANAAIGVGLTWAAGRTDRFTATHVTWVVAGLVIVTGAAVLGRVALRIWGTRYRLTSQRLFIARGILSQTIDQTELVRVDDVRIHKSLIDRFFGLGTVAIVSTDATDKAVSVEGIRGVEQVAEAVRAQTRLARKRSLYVENI